MNTRISTLHKILKDTTRSRIILLLTEKGQLTYTEMLDATEAGSTGRLNYHLKVLGDLLTKNDSGQYLLTERGKLASQLLSEYSKESIRQIEGKNGFTWKDAIWIVISNGLFLSVLFYFYSIGSISLYWLLGSIVLFVVAIFALVAFIRIPTIKSHYAPERQMAAAKIGFMLMGASIGMVIGIFGGGLLIIALFNSLRLAGGSQSFLSFPLWVIISSIVGIIIGGLCGYFVFKRSKYCNVAQYNSFN